MNKKDTQMDRDPNAIQYTKNGDAFVRCGATQKSVEAGFYDVVNTGYGIFGLKPKAIVADELIDIKGTIADEVFADIQKFMETGDRYAQYNLTHKRGYLFYGPPGSGKTSLGLMIARRFIEQANGVVMYVDDPSTFYNGVSIMRDVEPGRPSMYLIEEADSIVDNTSCLSILDGELSIQGAVFVAMTNYKEKLPPRISNRPGRFDRVMKVDCPPATVQVEYLRRVSARGPVPVEGRCDEEKYHRTVAQKIVHALDGISLSMAHLREAFISHVLMGLPLADLRARFMEMTATVSDEDDDDSESDPYEWKPSDDKC